MESYFLSQGIEPAGCPKVKVAATSSNKVECMNLIDLETFRALHHTKQNGAGKLRR